MIASLFIDPVQQKSYHCYYSARSLSAKRVFLFEVLLLRTAILTAFFVPTRTKTFFALVTQV